MLHIYYLISFSLSHQSLSKCQHFHASTKANFGIYISHWKTWMKSALSSRSISLSRWPSKNTHGTSQHTEEPPRWSCTAAAAAEAAAFGAAAAVRASGRAAYLREWQGACVPTARGCKGRGRSSIELALSRGRRPAPISSQLPLRGYPVTLHHGRPGRPKGLWCRPLLQPAVVFNRQIRQRHQRDGRQFQELSLQSPAFHFAWPRWVSFFCYIWQLNLKHNHILYAVSCFLDFTAILNCSKRKSRGGCLTRRGL